LSVDGKTECFTCEDVEREVKIPGETAIPRGVYKVIITYSQRFKRDLPLLVDVPGFQGIRIHSGNTAEDTAGCILVGRTKMPDGVYDSRIAFERLLMKIEAAIDAGQDVTIEVC
jgi:hypothetical protein